MHVQADHVQAMVCARPLVAATHVAARPAIRATIVKHVIEINWIAHYAKIIHLIVLFVKTIHAATISVPMEPRVKWWAAASNVCVPQCILALIVKLVSWVLSRLPTNIFLIPIFVDTNPCAANPCLNSGTCSIVGTSSYTCTCLSGYSGSTCQLCKTSFIFHQPKI